MGQDPPEVTTGGAVVCVGCCCGCVSCVDLLALGLVDPELAGAELAEPELAGAVGVAADCGAFVVLVAA